jgi:pimeloyl-ACP methyl ester carboxylesterase
MRGYGQTDQPQDIAAYTLLHMVGDMVGVLDALGEQSCVIGGHDWGAPVAWSAAQMRPDRFRAVVGLSVPFRPRGAVRPTTVMPRTADATFYMLYFQEPGVAEAELGRDPRSTIRRILYSGSGESPRPTAQVGAGNVGMVPRAGGFLSSVEPPATLPWLTEADIDFYAGEFARTGFRGGLNWYRNIDRNWELLAPWAGANVSVPAPSTSPESATWCSALAGQTRFWRLSSRSSRTCDRRASFLAADTGPSRSDPPRSMRRYSSF